LAGAREAVERLAALLERGYIGGTWDWRRQTGEHLPDRLLAQGRHGQALKHRAFRIPVAVRLPRPTLKR